MCGLFTKRTQYIDDMTPHEDEDFDLSGLDMKQVVTDKSGNTMLFAEEDESFCDAETLYHITRLRAIILIPRQSCILKLKFCQMNVKSVTP